METYAVILTPRGRDASVALSLLANSGIAGKAVATLPDFVDALADGALLALVTEEELRHSDLRELDGWLRAQPAWSDLPIIVLTHAGGGPERNPQAARLLQTLGNVSFIERPFHPTTFASIVAAAVGARRRQYDARARMSELAESQERLRTAIMAGKLGTWELDISSMRLDASATSKAAFGRGADDAFDYSDLVNSVHIEDRARMRAALQQAIKTGTDYQIEYRTIWPDGTLHWAEIHGRRLLSEEGTPSKMVGVSSDITARKNFEQRLLTVNEDLEQRVAERTVALEQAHQQTIAEMNQREQTEALLLQAQKVEAIGQLTGGVAHDFNNLLMAILGNLEVLRRHVGDDERSVRLIEGALEGARRGASLTQRLLAFARRQDLELKNQDLNTVVNGLLSLMRQSAGAGVDLIINPAPRPAIAKVDVNQIELALLNLVVNARDAMPEGGIVTIDIWETQVEAHSTLAPGAYVEIRVSDTGKGMDAETLRRSIEPFFSTKGIGKGTGLGLSMIHGLVLQLGGAFSIASTPGNGTYARILLPQAAVQPEQEIVPAARVAAAEPAGQSRILVVDDDALIAMSTVEMLEDLGHSVIETNSGLAALDVIKSGEMIDLMITDFSMPKMSGAELIFAARKLRPDLPVILASGYAELPGDVKLDVVRLGKPYQQRQLADQINTALGRKQST